MSPLRGSICFSVRFYKDAAPMALSAGENRIRPGNAGACKIDVMELTKRAVRAFALSVYSSLNQS